jgi:long-chain acyl-CoA synthetase
MQHNLCPKV